MGALQTREEWSSVKVEFGGSCAWEGSTLKLPSLRVGNSALTLLAVSTSWLFNLITDSFFFLDGFLPQILDGFFFDRKPLLEGTTPSDLWFRNDLRCNGTESRLADCPVEPFSNAIMSCSTDGIGILCPIEGEILRLPLPLTTRL